MIVVEGLQKRFRVPRRSERRLGWLLDVFDRRYEDVDAVADVTFSVGDGERVAFLGANGAGKTTTLKMLAGLLTPTSGSVRVGAHRPQDRDPEFLRSIALVLGQKQQLLWDLPPTDSFDLHRVLFDVDDARYRRTLDRLVELLAIGDVMRRPTRQLSLGERMKCELCCALLHEPRYLFLDEPTVGLDVTMQEAVRAFVRRYNEETGATLLLTSHYMADVEALCPRVIVIDGGRVRFDGTREVLRERAAPTKAVTLRFDRPVTRDEIDLLLKEFQNVSLPLESCNSTQELVLDVPVADVRGHLEQLLARLPVSDLVVADPPLARALQAVVETSSERS